MNRKISTIVIASLLTFTIFVGYLSLENENTAVAAQSFAFTDPDIRVDHDLGTNKSQDPEIVTDIYGRIFAVWQDDRNGKWDVYFSMSTDDGYTWMQEVQVNDIIDGAGSPSIATDSTNVYVVWSRGDTGIYFDKSLIDNIDFSGADIRVNSEVNKSGHPTIATDGTNIYVAWWHRYDDPVLFGDVLFKKSLADNIDFSGPDIKVNSNANPQCHCEPSIATDGTNVYVVWEGNKSYMYDWDIYFDMSPVTNIDFSGLDVMVNSDATSESQECPSIATDGTYVYVVWHDWRSGADTDIYFDSSLVSSIDFNTSDIRVNTDITPVFQYNPTIATDGTSVYVTWMDSRSGTDWDIYCKKLPLGGPGTGSPDIKVNSDTTTSNQYEPSIAVYNDTVVTNIFIAWTDNRNGNNDIYFALSPLPDLAVLSSDINFDLPTPVRNGTSVRINATIHNFGYRNASNIIVRFYDGVPSPSNQIGTDQTIYFIERDGGIGYAEVGWIATPVGTHNIYVVVDPKNTIAESNETNNIASKALEVIDVLPPTLYIKAIGDNIILNWTQSGTTGLSHYLLYRSTSQTDFDFNTVWVNTSKDNESGEPGPIPLRTMWNDTNAALPGDPSYEQQYYYVIRAVDGLGWVSRTSRTVGKWTKTFPQGVSTFSLPLEPLETMNMTTDYYLKDMNAIYIRCMDPVNHIWMKHGDGGINDTEMKLGEGYEVKFDNQANFTFTGMPGTMIRYKTGGFIGFDYNTDAKNLSASVDSLTGNVTLIWDQPSSLDGDDSYKVYRSTTRNGFDEGTTVLLDTLIYGDEIYIDSGVASSPGQYYYMVVPVNETGFIGPSTYSIGIWTEEYISEYDTLGIPLKQSFIETADWYCDNIPDSVGINYYIHKEQRWGWHSTRMPAGAYDPILEMSEGYQISTSGSTKFTFIGI